MQFLSSFLSLGKRRILSSSVMAESCFFSPSSSSESSERISASSSAASASRVCFSLRSVSLYSPYFSAVSESSACSLASFAHCALSAITSGSAILRESAAYLS